MQRLKVLAILLIFGNLVLAASGKEEARKFRTSASLYLTIPSIRALAEVVVTVLPGFTYMEKNTTIGLNINLGPIFQLNIDSIYGANVNLSKEEVVLKVIDEDSKSLRAGIKGFNTTVLIHYDCSLLWGLLEFHGPLNITIEDAEAYFTVTFDEIEEGYKFSLYLDEGSFDYGLLHIVSHRGYPGLDYMIRSFQFVIPYLANALLNNALSSINDVLSSVLEETDPTKQRLKILPHSNMILNPLSSLTLNSAKATLQLTDACVQVVDNTTDEPYYDRPTKSRPIYFDDMHVQNQIALSENFVNSLIKALAIDKQEFVEFSTEDDSLEKILSEFPEIKRVVNTDFFLVNYGFAPESIVTANKSIIHIGGKMRIRVDAKMHIEDKEIIEPLITFYPEVSVRVNMTISRYRMFLMIKEVTVLKGNKDSIVKHNKKIDIKGNEEEVKESLQATLTEESSCLNGDFLIPLDLRTNQVVEYASKYLKDAALRFDRIDNYFILGFNPHQA
eukprot:TRINITY_DN16616_c0_g1_i11.p1 TRINITY_DN16616_c0_g1~~TRINITY_DN16616_c0_g1_i11.p1  ORF type:complete len:502 (+),score=142.20 TRINITY_DN16616_c0_g1_i11:56-1561(+)